LWEGGFKYIPTKPNVKKTQKKLATTPSLTLSTHKPRTPFIVLPITTLNIELTIHAPKNESCWMFLHPTPCVGLVKLIMKAAAVDNATGRIERMTNVSFRAVEEGGDDVRQ